MTTVFARHSAEAIAAALGQHRPTDEQRAVIEAPLAPQLVVAGAGSGKTETMAARVVYLVANGEVSGEEVLGLTFTRKAAGELTERVRLRLRQLRTKGLLPTSGQSDTLEVDSPAVLTYNSFAADIAREHALRIGMDPDARLITAAGAWQLAHHVVQGWHGALEVDTGAGAVTQAVLALAGALNEHLLISEEAREQLDDLVADLVAKAPGGRRTKPYADVAKVATSLRERHALLDLVDAFTRAKRERGVVEFGDQVAQAARVAEHVPAVGQALREQYRLVLLDEYQDTSVAQLRLLRALFGRGHAVTAVGDPNQAIYGWRGAAAATLGQFPTDFPADGRHGQPTTPTRFLRTSWRNDERILDLANTVSAPLRPQGDVAHAVDVPRLVSRPGAAAGAVHGAYAQSLSQEAEVVAEFFAARWQPGTSTTFAVLCRSRRQFEPIVAALHTREVPVEVIGLGGLLLRPEVVDVRSALTAAHDATRGDALMRLLTAQHLGITDLHTLYAWARDLAGEAGPAEAGLVEAVEQPPPVGWRSPAGHTFSEAGGRRVAEVGALLRQVRSLTYLALPELVTHTTRLLALDIEVASRAGQSPAEARADLEAFVHVAADFASGAETATLGSFLDWLAAAEEHERGLEPADAEPQPGAVQVLTAHAAKGLEWDVVAVPGLVEKQFPHYDTGVRDDGSVEANAWLTDRSALPYPLRGDAESLPLLAVAGTATHVDVEEARKDFRAAAGAHAVAEERRLAYVAFTRARHELLLTGSWFRTGKTPLAPSRFLTEPRAAGLVTDLPRAWTAPPADGAANPDAETAVEVHWPHDPLGQRRDRLEAAAARIRDLLEAGGGAPSVADNAAEVERRWWRDADLLLKERVAARSAVAEVSLGGHLSATAAVGLSADPQRFALERRRPVPQAPSSRAQLGNRFHAWVEEFYATPSLLELDEDTGREHRDDGADVTPVDDDELSALQAIFNASVWSQRRPVAVEVDLETAVGPTLVRCRIDAVFDDEHGLEVVDWKTGAPPRDERVRQERELQLALYRLAWARRTGRPLAAVTAAFYYVSADTTVRAGQLSEAEIEQRLAHAITSAGGGDEDAATVAEAPGGTPALR